MRGSAVGQRAGQTLLVGELAELRRQLLAACCEAGQGARGKRGAEVGQEAGRDWAVLFSAQLYLCHCRGRPGAVVANGSAGGSDCADWLCTMPPMRSVLHKEEALLRRTFFIVSAVFGLRCRWPIGL